MMKRDLKFYCLRKTEKDSNHWKKYEKIPFNFSCDNEVYNLESTILYFSNTKIQRQKVSFRYITMGKRYTF